MDRDEILRLNPQIDPHRAEEYLRYVEELRRAGIDVAPKYRLSPALGQFPADTTAPNRRTRAAGG
jgi:hypothetical protein